MGGGGSRQANELARDRESFYRSTSKPVDQSSLSQYNSGIDASAVIASALSRKKETDNEIRNQCDKLQKDPSAKYDLQSSLEQALAGVCAELLRKYPVTYTAHQQDITDDIASIFIKLQTQYGSAKVCTNDINNIISTFRDRWEQTLSDKPVSGGDEGDVKSMLVVIAICVVILYLVYMNSKVWLVVGCLGVVMGVYMIIHPDMKILSME